ncbi:MAG: hypothetical protein RIS70_2719 [Planctomycetota bacterium]
MIRSLSDIPLSRVPMPSWLRRWTTAHQPVVVAYWDRAEVHYFVSCRRAKSIRPLAAGSLVRVPETDPVEQLASHLASSKLACRRIVLLLSRSELELSTLNLPPAEPDEIPSLVAAEVEQQFGDSTTAPLVDYFVVPGAAGSTTDVMAFSLSSELVSRWQETVRRTGMQLAAISSRQLAPLGILRRRGDLQLPLSVAISLYSGEVELTLCKRETPLFLRTLRVSSDDPRTLAEQIVLEIQRCIALTSGLDRAGAPELLLFGREEEHRGLVEALQEQPIGSLKVVHPLQDWPESERNNAAFEEQLQVVANSSGGAPITVDNATVTPEQSLSDAALPDGKTTSAAQPKSSGQESPALEPRPSRRVDSALVGAAWDFLHDGIEIDLLAPRRAPVPPHPARRWAALAAGVAFLLIAAMVVLYSDLDAMRTELAERERELTDKQRVADKVQEKADETRFVEQWLSDQVDWLDALQTVSSRLPDARHATIRRLNATTNADGAAIDLAVQVSDPDRLAELESGLRAAAFSVSSRRVSQQALNDEYPWQFETRATFEVTPPKATRYRPKSASSPAEDSAQQTDKPDEPDTAEAQSGNKDAPRANGKAASGRKVENKKKNPGKEATP